MTKLQLNCAAEYTLAARVDGTYSVAAVPALQGACVASPNAARPIEERLEEKMMRVSLLAPENALVPSDERLVGRVMDSRLEQSRIP